MRGQKSFPGATGGKNGERRVVEIFEFRCTEIRAGISREFERIKNISADDVIVSHRVHPALVAVKPAAAASFGDIEKMLEILIENLEGKFRKF